MKAIILAAGRGSRMKNLTEERPKCMVELHGRPLLEWQLAALRGAGIEQIAIVTGYKRELLSNRGLMEFHNPRWAETNMVTSLTYAHQWLRSEPCVVSYSDIFYEASAPRLLMETDAELAITYDPNWRVLWESRFGDPLSDAETFKMDSRRVLLEIGQRPTRIEDIQGQYMGLLRIEPEGWAEIVRIRDGLTMEQKDKMHMTGTLQMVIDAHRIPIEVIPYQGMWGEVDSEADLNVYEKG
jgi:choline kinase